MHYTLTTFCYYANKSIGKLLLAHVEFSDTEAKI